LRAPAGAAAAADAAAGAPPGGGLPAGFPHWRLSGYYCLYFAVLGCLLPSWPLYLKWQGFDAFAISMLAAVLIAAKSVMPNVWAWLAERLQINRVAAIRMLTLGACLSFAGFFLADSYRDYLLLLLLFGCFWTGPLPMLEAATFRQLGVAGYGYTRVRVWGSIGFLASVWALGLWFQAAGVASLPAIMMCLLLSVLALSGTLPRAAGENGCPAGCPAGRPADLAMPLRAILRRPPVLALLAVCFLMQASHGPYYVYYSLFLQERGYLPGLIGQLWAAAVLAEVCAYTVMHRVLTRLGPHRLLLAALLLAALRWLLVGALADSLPALLFAQLLHAASFGAHHAAAIQFVCRFFPEPHLGRGQALYSSVSFGAGLAAGSLCGGWAWRSLGPEQSFQCAALASLAGAWVAWRYLRRNMRPPRTS